jgi:hypothetical protein
VVSGIVDRGREKEKKGGIRGFEKDENGERGRKGGYIDVNFTFPTIKFFEMGW